MGNGKMTVTPATLCEVECLKNWLL